MNKLTVAIVTGVVALGLIMPSAAPVDAAVANWHKGVSMVPNSPDDFGSQNFRQSVTNAHNDHANTVALIIPYYQSNIGASDIHAGWNTPTDASLISAINHIHSLGMRVNLKPHIDSYDGRWRGDIDPWDRDAWFRAYSDLLNRYANLAKDHGVEQITVGTELIHLTDPSFHDDNTSRWYGLIAGVRERFSGRLTYSANWGSAGWTDEKNHVEFWPALDAIGISAYFPLSSPDIDPESLRREWDRWNRDDIGPLQRRWNKPIELSEIGYRSLSGTRFEPFNFWNGGNPDDMEQANLYEAMFSYWNNHEYVTGVNLWNWETDPNAGGSGATSFTPQRKPAEDVMRRWFGGNATSTPGQPGGGTGEEPGQQPGSGMIDLWWPTNGVAISGIQPFKAMVQGRDVNSYVMYWRVDGDRLNRMETNYADYPHKEIDVDVSGWWWRGHGPYRIDFIAHDMQGNTIGTKSIDIYR